MLVHSFGKSLMDPTFFNPNASYFTLTKDDNGYFLSISIAISVKETVNGERVTSWFIYPQMTRSKPHSHCGSEVPEWA